jgi:hypothetical protein
MMFFHNRRIWLIAFSGGMVFLFGFAQPLAAETLHGSIEGLLQPLPFLQTIAQTHNPQAEFLVVFNYFVRRILIPVIYALLILRIILLLQGDGR